MVDAATHDLIKEHLGAVAESRGVEVLYAVESGSRAWGFASPDSDYDIRFIYRHPPEWYLSVRERRDVIELPLDDRSFDVSGWDLRKALRLFLKSNPSLHEWLASPIVYSAIDEVAEALRDLAAEQYSRRALALHYRNLAVGQWKGYIRDQTAVAPKKYLYAVRPLACLLWLCRKNTLPPVPFREVLDAVGFSPLTQQALDDLLARKRQGEEKAVGARVSELDEWIVDTLDVADDMTAGLSDDGPAVTDVDALFRRWVGFEGLKTP